MTKKCQKYHSPRPLTPQETPQGASQLGEGCRQWLTTHCMDGAFCKLWTEASHWAGGRGGMWFVPEKAVSPTPSYIKYTNRKALCPKDEKKLFGAVRIIM